MKRIYTITLLLFTFFQLFSQRRFDVRFPLDGHMRECIIVQPSTPPPPGGYPIVYMLHGTSGDGEKFYNISGWKELGEAENFITVFPSSLSWCYVEDGIEKHNTRWVNGTVTESPCSGAPQDYVDDVKFLKLLAKLISDSLPVNRSMIFACGFSNGCSMIHKLSVDAGDVFAALAGSSSVLSQSDSARPIVRIPLWTMVGSLDDLFLVPPFTELPFGGDSILGYLQTYIRRTLGCQGLEESFVKVQTDSLHTYQFLANKPGEVAAPYLFTLARGMEHEFPNGTNYFFNGPRRFWEFFKKSVTVANSSIKNGKAEVRIYPNPSKDDVFVDFLNFTDKSPIQIMIFNSIGQSLYCKKLAPTAVLQISRIELGEGLYFMQIHQGLKKSTQRFILD
ncbi:MAG: T9SS type A sorting domain-containing protein [Saprospiraceae bacterium]|jgi:polyhydroxybutyrate depolymerase|nr:T9SS type A sorting domain-containing protein [Saprospiraceae bacterium]MBP9208724.1 T9SS type A sorting domain-containing protein [Saprospiraceae bacterium]